MPFRLPGKATQGETLAPDFCTFASMTKGPIGKAVAPLMALACGVVLYIGRGPTRGEAALGIDDALAPVRRALGPLVQKLPAFVLGSAPDAAWSFALASALAAFGAGRAWLVAGFVLAVGFEVAQAFHLLSGTFDPVDVIAIVLGYAVGLRLSLSRHATGPALQQRRAQPLGTKS
jgi:hypothetical protein